MTPPTNRSPCPRCGAPVTGQYKFCPTCACRLQSDAEWEPEPLAPAARWPQVVLVLLMGTLLAALLVIGWRLFVEPPSRPPSGMDTPPELRGPLTIATLKDRMIHLYGATATYWESPDGLDDWPVQVGDCLFGELEVSRREWREFMEACEADPSRIPPFLRELWRPVVAPEPEQVTEEQRVALSFSNQFIDAWWDRVQEHHAEVLERKVERPSDFVAPLPESYRNLLLAPPSWVRIGTYEEFNVALPEGTERLPVTDVSWYDAYAFTIWASEETGLKLRLPTVMEWIRAGNGGDSERRYPWDDPQRDADYIPRYACNSLLFWGQTDTPELLRVDYRFADGGPTLEGIQQMSGNAREWLQNHELTPRDGYYATVLNEKIVVIIPGETPEEDIEVEKVLDRAPTMGGSYREAIEDCTVDLSSLRLKSKFGRWDDVGFRLWAPSTWMGQ